MEASMPVPPRLHERPGTAEPAAVERPNIALLTSKLAPPTLGCSPVGRHRLMTAVSEGVERTPVTLLSGPAGSGKTVLAASWMQENGGAMPVAWLSLDENDDDPATFWSYVAEALSRSGVDLAELERPLPGEQVPSTFMPMLAAHLLAGARPVVLVLDNSDNLSDRSLLGALDLLVRHAGSRLRLMLCARADPQLPLHQYRLAGTLTEIRSDRLAFTPEETSALLDGLDTPVSADVADELQTVTEGWAVGLRLATAPLEQGVDPQRLVEALAADDGSVGQYLFAEVLDDLPLSVRRFLMRASVTQELWPELVERLTGRSDGRRILASLARRNAFVEAAPGSPGGYRIHALFREMLKAQLAYEYPREVAPLHRVCAAWQAAAGRVAVAVRHAVVADDWGLAASLLIDDLAVGRWLARDGDPLLKTVTAIPAGVAGPEGAVIRAAAALALGEPAAPEDLELSARTAQDAASRRELRLSAAVVWAAGGGSSEAVTLADGLLAGLPKEARRDLAAVVAGVRADVLLRGESPDTALLAALRAALTAANAAGSGRLRARVLGDLALLEALHGHLRRAAELVKAAEALASERSPHEAQRLPAAATAAAWVSVERYQHAEARRWMARAQANDGSAAGSSGPLLAVLNSRLLRIRHELDAAEAVLRPHLDDDDLPRWVRDEVVVEHVRICLLHGRSADGLRMLRRLGAQSPRAELLRATAAALADPPGPRAPVALPVGDLPLVLTVERDILRACLAGPGSEATALVALEQALHEAGPERLRRPFLDGLPQVRRLLRTHPRLAITGAWLNPSAQVPVTVQSAGGAPAEPATPAVIAELTEREREVLGHLAGMLSTAEIAGAMFVSVNTVRTHVRSILRKLSVSRRNEAVRRARTLKII
jgi:LuxR family maltose regulon positive regulatory protein